MTKKSYIVNRQIVNALATIEVAARTVVLAQLVEHRIVVPSVVGFIGKAT